MGTMFGEVDEMLAGEMINIFRNVLCCAMVIDVAILSVHPVIASRWLHWSITAG